MAVDAFALILAMLGLGLVFARLRVLPDNSADVLNRIVLYICLPASVLTYVPRLHLDASLGGVIATPWLLTALIVPMLWGCSRLLGVPRDECAALLMCVVFTNSSFIGFPMVRALIGDHALPYAVVYDQFGTFVLLSTFGLYVLARYSGDTPPTARMILARVLRFPPLWALVFALTLMPEQLPAWIGSGLKSLADAMLPLVMLAVGFSLQLRLPAQELKPLALGLLFKLAVMPVLALPLSWALGLQGQMLQTNVLESAMPTMITAAALAISHRLAPRLAAAMVGYSILLSLLTLPAWAWLLARLAA
ncbi:AEC family transporter [Xanthomonas campestris pv. raphani]|uniref:AEC family transporter n=1 Tax=Xanthomonas campestris TaxID=339 RepID=UPI00021AF33F|nr:AEC family transporter [Xanthomonas campestris]AEL09216.1 possible malate permease [Xanthomonas campestris pv. raphani 756C]MEA9676988.1 AEC family transporter [Xanthomonas campestris pv. raphani]MEA9777136.1 AEC family transporter [Xanthomonas campestris pv. raphani]MEA9918972.1 AEC family transporter [Xanthomonas campestris pv. raphani]